MQQSRHNVGRHARALARYECRATLIIDQATQADARAVMRLGVSNVRGWSAGWLLAGLLLAACSSGIGTEAAHHELGELTQALNTYFQQDFCDTPGDVPMKVDSHCTVDSGTSDRRRDNVPDPFQQIIFERDAADDFRYEIVSLDPGCRERPPGTSVYKLRLGRAGGERGWEYEVLVSTGSDGELTQGSVRVLM